RAFEVERRGAPGFHVVLEPPMALEPEGLSRGSKALRQLRGGGSRRSGEVEIRPRDGEREQETRRERCHRKHPPLELEPLHDEDSDRRSGGEERPAVDRPIEKDRE